MNAHTYKNKRMNIHIQRLSIHIKMIKNVFFVTAIISQIKKHNYIFISPFRSSSGTHSQNICFNFSTQPWNDLRLAKSTIRWEHQLTCKFRYASSLLCIPVLESATQTGRSFYQRVYEVIYSWLVFPYFLQNDKGAN